MSDLHIRDLLVFSAKMDFHDHYLYKAGHIILQDKVRDVQAHGGLTVGGIHSIIITNLSK